MMLFASFLASKWRWVVFAGAIVLAIAFGAQGVNYASSWLARRHGIKQVDRTEAAHATRAAAEPGQQHHFDSTVFSQIGRHREMVRQAELLKKQDEALTRRLPAAPALPAEPARY